MAKQRITVTLDNDVSAYLETVSNKSRVVSEAVREYCASRLERELEEAYRADYEESERLAAEWSSADADVEE